MLRHVRKNEGTRKINKRHFESEDDTLYYDGYTRELKRSRRYYEGLSNSDVERIMETLREQNKSNKLDSGNFRWSEALNLVNKLLDEEAKGYPYNSDINVSVKFKRAGYSSARDLISEIAGAVDRRLRELTQVKKDLDVLKQIAISFDLMPGHN